MDQLREQVTELQDAISQIEKRVEEVATMANRPFFTSKQLLGVTAAIISTVFAAGMWANSTQQSIAAIQETLMEVRGDLKQLGEVAVLKARVDLISTELDRLRDARETVK